MSASRSNTARPHRSDPSEGCKIIFVEKGAAQTPEFPIVYPWEGYIDPELRPLRYMLVIEEMEIGYCHSGSGIIIVADRVVPFSPGSISVLGERTLHMALGEKGTLSRWSYFWLDRRRLLTGMPDDLEILGPNPFTSPDYPYIFSPGKYASLCRAVRAIMDELNGRGPGHRMAAKGLICAFLVALQRACQNVQPGPQTPERSGLVRVAPALHWMASHYADHIDVVELARLCNLSPVHFRRVFLAALGRPPLDYLTQLRVRMAAAILSDMDKPISLIAYEVGFESINTFNRQFRAAMGATPSEWRSQQGKP